MIIAYIPAFNEDETIGGGGVQALKYVDRVVGCDDEPWDLTGEIAQI